MKEKPRLGNAANTYEIIRQLATGGMADVHLARLRGLWGISRNCVIKLMRDDIASDPQFVQRFHDEAHLSVQLQHPNIASVFDVGSLNGRFFLAMEYVHGQTIHSLLESAAIRREMIPLSCALSIVVGIAAALHSAHEHRDLQGRALHVVHRDATPTNVMITYEGHVKVMDFGVAKAEHRAIKTCEGMVIGKIAYLSPEQCRGERVDRRSDLFSLGIIFWELLAVCQLYARGNDLASMHAIQHEPAAPPSSFRRDVPECIDQIVLRLLAKSADERFQRADEVIEVIEEAATRCGIVISTAAVKRFMGEVFGPSPELPFPPDISQGARLSDLSTRHTVVISPPDANAGRPKGAARRSLPTLARLVPMLGVAALCGSLAARRITSGEGPRAPIEIPQQLPPPSPTTQPGIRPDIRVTQLSSPPRAACEATSGKTISISEEHTKQKAASQVAKSKAGPAPAGQKQSRPEVPPSAPGDKPKPPAPQPLPPPPPSMPSDEPPCAMSWPEDEPVTHLAQKYAYSMRYLDGLPPSGVDQHQDSRLHNCERVAPNVEIQKLMERDNLTWIEARYMLRFDAQGTFRGFRKIAGSKYEAYDQAIEESLRKSSYETTKSVCVPFWARFVLSP